MKILACDQATTTGYAIGTKDGLIASGKLRMPKRSDPERLAFLHREICSLVDAHQPDMVVTEKPFFPVGNARKFNPATIAWSHQIKGVIWTIAGLNGLSVEEYTPAEWRTTLLGYAMKPRGADDKHMKRAVISRLRAMGYKVESDDESDAIGLLLNALHGPPASARMQGDLLQLAGAPL